MRAEVFLQGLISFLIVAFGQPTFAPWLGPISAVLGYALFWRAIRIYPFRMQRFWRGFAWYSSISLVQLSWMTSIEYQGIYILGVWLGLCIWLGVQFGLLTLLIPYNRQLSWSRILAIASAWTLLEWSRYHVICGYSWNLSGLALSSQYAIQLASIFGILGLSFWVIFVNLLGLRAFLRKGIVHYVIWLGFACIPYMFGAVHLSYHDRQIAKMEDLPILSCALIQTGLLPPQKIPIQGRIRSYISPYDQWKRVLLFLKEGKSKVLDLIVLPEAAVPFSSAYPVYEEKEVKQIFSEVFGPSSNEIFPNKEPPYGKGNKVTNTFWAQAISNLFNSEVVIGLDYSDASGVSHNSAFHATPFSNKLNRYDKRVLMPLAEYLPFKWLAPLVKCYGITDFFTPGREATLFSSQIPFSTSICYEETFPHTVREGRLLGAQLLVNVTNDGWYPSSRLPSQHFEHSKFRTLENGCPLVRSCNTGVTAALDSLGRTIGGIEEKNSEKKIQSGVLFAEVPIYTYPTLYTFWGNLGILSLCILFIAIFLGSILVKHDSC